MLVRSLFFVIAATAITACSGGSSSQPGILPQATSTGGSGATVYPKASNSTASTGPVVVQSHGYGGACTSSRSARLAVQPTAGDLIVIYAMLNNTSDTLTAPTGFSTKDSSSSEGWGKWAEFYKIATGSEGSSYTVGSNCSSGAFSYLVADVKNVNRSAPFAQHSFRVNASTGVSTFTTASLAPTRSGELPLAMVAAGTTGLGVYSHTPSTWISATKSGYFTQNLWYGPSAGTSAVEFSETTSSATDYASTMVLDLIAPSGSPSSAVGTSSSTPRPSTVASTGSPYEIFGCQVYTPNDWFTTNLTTGGSSYAVNTVDPNSVSIINNYIAQNPDSFDFNAGPPHLSASGTPFNNDTGSAPMVGVSGINEGFYDPYNLDPSKSIPWQSSFLAQGSCTTGDCHTEVIDSGNCVEYGTYVYAEQSWNGATFTTNAMAVHNLKEPYSSQDSGTGTTAAGFTLLGVYDTGDDEQNYIARGQVIPHILAIELSSRNGAGGYVAPASEEKTCSGNCSYRLPFGARLRLNPSRYTCPSASTNPQANLLCQQMETYGVIIADFGNSQVLQTEFEPSHDGTDPWNASDVSSLDDLKLEDFDVMTLGAIH
jgi:hypothetical protein